MLVVPGVDFEASLALFVAATISHFTSKDETCALHEIVHDVFQLWLEVLVVDQVEVDLLVCGDVYSDIAFDEIEHSFMMQCLIVRPSVDSCPFVHDSFEEEYLR